MLNTSKESSNTRLIIVRVREGQTDQIVHYLQESLEQKVCKYYISGEADSQIIANQVGTSGMIAFVIFNEITEQETTEILKIYVGYATIGGLNKDTNRLRIDYSIAQCLSNEMMINNFISNSELDLKGDYGQKSYIHIGQNPDLVRQLSAIINPFYQLEISLPQKSTLKKENQNKTLHLFSQYDTDCIRVYNLIPAATNRSEFQRDYERIVHSKAYRRLVDKAQIFTSSKGDHYRTRLTHTLEVAQIARGIAIELNLNAELTEAIALAHDLGHTPFGHQGERTLDKILKGDLPLIPEFVGQPANFYGGFKHNFQGVRVASFIENKYIDFDGIDLSYQVLEGILKHTSVKIKDCSNCANASKNIDNSINCTQKCFDLKEFLPDGDVSFLYPQYNFSTTLEGQIVAISDEIAQRSHDLDDSFSSGILTIQQLDDYLSIEKMHPLRDSLSHIKDELNSAKEKHRLFANENELHHSRIISKVITFFIQDVIETSKKNIQDFEKSRDENLFYTQEHRFDTQLIDFSATSKILCKYLEKIITKKVINSPEVVLFDNKSALIVEGLFAAYYNNPKLLHETTLRKIFIEMRKLTYNVIDFLEGDREEVSKELERIQDPEVTLNCSNEQEYIYKRKVLVRCIVDYIAGMTDSYATNEYHKIYD